MVTIDSALVQKLITAQFPQWSGLFIKPVEFSGWDNRTFHLGADMTVRLPSDQTYALQVTNEQHWLPKLAPSLPLSIPTPIAMGKPGEGYLWNWSIYRWIPGHTATIAGIQDLSQFAVALAEFLVGLQYCDSTGGPTAGPQNFYRGGALATYDGEAREAIAALKDKSVAAAITKIWNEALASTWERPPVWVHGDIAVGNLLVQNGQLSAVIDFGQLAIGDPACDLAIAWTLFSGESRAAFQSTLKLDQASWVRGSGWALWKALCWAFPGEKRIDWRVVNEILSG
jgi:aminoglycoside phosphotransferase (APT) family kinase protein